MKSTTKYGIILALVAGIAGIYFWRTGRTALAGKESEPAQHSVVAAEPKRAGESRDVKREAGALLEIARRVTSAERDRWSADRVISELKSAKTSADKQRTLGQLRDGRYDRKAAIEALRLALKDDDIAVRVLAADLLFQWGSTDGKQTLLKIVSEARSTPAADLIQVVRAAEVLSNNKETIPYDSLVALYRETRDAGVLRVMAAQKDDRYLAFLLERARAEPNGMVRLIGDLGASGGYDVAKQVFERTRSPEVLVDAAWAMYRCGGDEQALAYLVAQARAGLEGKQGTDPFAANLAIQHLALIPSESARQVLEEAMQSSNGSASSAALASLYFVQKDFAYVDQFLITYLEHPSTQAQQAGDGAAKPMWSVNQNLIWRIVRERNDPHITSLAITANRGRSEDFLGTAGAFPVANTWLRGYLRMIPSGP